MQVKSSIIIPTAGRPHEIKAAIRSLLALAPDRHDAEILVIDNNCKDELADDLAAYCSSLNGQVRYFREQSPGSTAARHRGIRESHGDLLTFVDDDVCVSPEWLGAVQHAFRDPAVAMVGGPSIPTFTGSVPAWLWRFITPTPHGGWMCSWLSLLDNGRDVQDIDPQFVWSLNLSIRRSVIERCSGFHPDLLPPHLHRWQGDGETGLALKVAAAGCRADYVQRALLFHHCGSDRLNLDYFTRRAQFQGICDSFTAIRAGGDPAHDSPPGNSTMYAKYRAWAGNAARDLLARRSPGRAAYIEIRHAMDGAYAEGWRFHQREVVADPSLLAWVRRTDFVHADVRDEQPK